MGNSLAFHPPHGSSSYYQRTLLHRPDLIRMVTSEDEKIQACYIQPRCRNPLPVTLLYSHGNAEDLAGQMDYVAALAEEVGAAVFAYEYVGYGLSRLEDGAAPSEEACLRSADAAWRYCVETLKIPAERIVIFGRSIGSGPAVYLAARPEVKGCPISPLQVAGVLLQSPIESGARAVFGHAVSVLGYRLDLFRNYEKIGNIRAPVAIMHGTEDTVVPVQNGRALHELLQQPFEPLWIEGHGHNDMPYQECFHYTRRFLEWLVQNKGRRSG